MKLKMKSAALSLFVLSIFSAGVASVFGQACGADGKTYKRWTPQQVKSYSGTGCLVILYNTVYDLRAFSQIHKGGEWSIVRNCGRDITEGYKRLQCIKDVPDHTIGILNMVADDIVGVLAGGNACPITQQDYTQPDFGSCDVYDRVKCSSLASMPLGGKWTASDVTTPSVYPSRKCLISLYNHVYDFGALPYNGIDPNGVSFVNKHGGGSKAILDHCNEDITTLFKSLIKKRGIPDHTRGSMNAIYGYLVGVIKGSDADPCVNPPPNPRCGVGKLKYMTMTQVRNFNGCAGVIWGKVYSLNKFATYHYGGKDEIFENCGQDMTSDFFEKPFHTVVHLGSIQDYQIGVIKGSIADPCSANYVQDPKAPNGGGGGGDGGDSDDSSGDSSSGGSSRKLMITSPSDGQTVKGAIVVKTTLQGVQASQVKQVTFSIKSSGSDRLLKKKKKKGSKKLYPKRNKQFSRDLSAPYQAKLPSGKYRNGEYTITAVALLNTGGKLISQRKVRIAN